VNHLRHVRHVRRIRRDDRGATAVIVAVMIVTLFGFGAIVIDVGAMYQEHRVLQNGADAGALAVARDCGTTSCGDFTTTAAGLANGNADDGASSIDEVCGTGSGMSTCTDPPTVPAGAGYVRVTTKTKATDGTDKLPFGFARIFGFNSTTERARAVAVWGGPSALKSSLPVTISECEYNAYTSTGTVLAPPPPYPPFPASPPYSEATIYLHDTTGASPCTTSATNSDLPGGFGWLSTTSGCNATSDTSGWFSDKTGRPPPTSCTWPLMAAEWQTVVAIPIFDQTNNLNGSNGSYHMEGFAAFYVTGYYIEGAYKEPSVVTGHIPCSGQSSCISGYFVDDPSIFSGSVGGASMGVTVVNLVQ
jgi:Flp pilus assembly protein TadG